jgi:Spy/CpxP family protein refolding chaperone
MKSNRLLALSLILFVFSIGPTFAQTGSGMPGDRERRHGERGMMPGEGRMRPDMMMKGPHGDLLSPEMMREALGLNDEQVQKLRQLRSDYEKETIRKHADLRVAQLELKDLLEQKNIDMSQVEKKIRQTEGLRSDLMLFRVKSLMKAKDFLSAEQFDRLRKMTLAMAAHRGGGMMGGPMMGGGMMRGPMMGNPHEDSGEMMREEDYDE